MQKLKKIAKGFDVVCKVLFWIIVIIAIISFIAFFSILFFKNDTLSSFLSDNFVISYAFRFKILFEQNSRIKMLMLFIMGLVVLACIISLYVLKLIHNILDPMKDGKPFNGSVSTGFHKLGWFTIIVGIAGNILNILTRYIILKTFSNSYHVSLGIKGAFVYIDFDLSFVLVAFLIFLLCYVFKYGEELQQFSDETL